MIIYYASTITDNFLNEMWEKYRSDKEKIIKLGNVRELLTEESE
jgi:hypothetical protein